MCNGCLAVDVCKCIPWRGATVPRFSKNTICEVHCMYIPVMYGHGMAWHMHVLTTTEHYEIGHNVSRITIVLASLKLRLSRACIQGERALTVVSVAVASPK